MKKIDNPDNYLICESDSVFEVGVYVNGLSELVRVNDRLKWRVDKDIADMCECDGKVLTLTEIVNQLQEYRYGNGIITIIIMSPLSGEVLQHGNYGDSWWVVGELYGYA